MATRIRASCGDCGDVELRVDDVDVRVCDDDGTGTYVFRCPVCTMAVVKEAEPRVVDLLTASGVRLTRWTMPSELWEAKQGPSFTHDDLLDFHDLLETADWFDRLAAAQDDSDPAVDGR